MNIVDRILNGEFDDENIKVDEGNDPTPDPNEELDLNDVDPDSLEEYLKEGGDPSDLPTLKLPEEDEEVYEEEDEEEGEFSSEEVEDLDSTLNDTPSEEWMNEYAKKNNIEILNEPELAATASVPYVEKPKQSKVREINKKKDTMTTHSADTNNNTPKQSVASTTEHKKRGAPHKLKDNLENVVRFYNEGVGAKQIAEKFGVSVSCVINTLKRNNVAVRPKGRRSNDTESSSSAKPSKYKLKTND